MGYFFTLSWILTTGLSKSSSSIITKDYSGFLNLGKIRRPINTCRDPNLFTYLFISFYIEQLLFIISASCWIKNVNYVFELKKLLIWIPLSLWFLGPNNFNSCWLIFNSNMVFELLIEQKFICFIGLSNNLFIF